jgi:hypothetical protein
MKNFLSFDLSTIGSWVAWFPLVKFFSVGKLGLVVKVTAGCTCLYYLGGFDTLVSGTELYQTPNGHFLINQANITGGADYRAAEAGEALCNFYSDIIALEYSYIVSYLTDTLAHSCSLDVVAKLPFNITTYEYPFGSSGQGDLYAYHGYMGDTHMDVTLDSYSEWASQSNFSVRPIFSNNSVFLQLIGNAIRHQGRLPVGNIYFVPRNELYEFNEAILQKACSVSYCYQVHNLYVTHLHERFTFINFSHDQMLMRSFR